MRDILESASVLNISKILIPFGILCISRVVSETIILSIIFVGLILMMAEAVIPGVQFIVVGIATLVTGLLALIIPIPNILFIIPIFTVVSLVTILIYKNVNLTGDEIDRTTDSDDLKFAEGVVQRKVTKSEGSVILNDSNSMSNVFQARCPHGEIEPGSEITVTDSRGGSVLEVMPKKESKMDKMYGLNEEDEVNKNTNKDYSQN